MHAQLSSAELQINVLIFTSQSSSLVFSLVTALPHPLIYAPFLSNLFGQRRKNALNWNATGPNQVHWNGSRLISKNC